MTTSLTVELDTRAYPIHVGAGLLASLGVQCHDAGLNGRALMVTDATVQSLHAGAAMEALREAGIEFRCLAVAAGEGSKSHVELIRIYDAALEAGLERSSFMIALGGGVVGDLAGYAAATYLRGIRYVQVPTTLLAMVDSAVGGKTGINLPQGKNLIGCFHQPTLVVADTHTLRTLPPREFSAGVAEVIKYGVIAEPDLFDLLESHTPESLIQDDAALEEIVERSCAIKAEVVRQDEREGGLRAILNFGHTLGHAIEQVSGYGVYLHGEAISIGMMFAARLSGADYEDRLRALLTRYRLPTAAPDLDWSELLTAMQRDKKKSAGTVKFVLAPGLGDAKFGCEVSPQALEAAWSAIKAA